MSDSSRPVALITMATGYVGPALARTMADRGYDLVLQGAAGDGSMVGVEQSFDDQVPAARSARRNGRDGDRRRPHERRRQPGARRTAPSIDSDGSTPRAS